jgi:hypothetical protein
METKETVAQVWQKLEAVRKAKIPTHEREQWQPLIGAYIAERLFWNELLDTLRGAWEAQNPSRDLQDILPASRPAPRAQGLTRPQILADIAAAHANRDPAVIRFRETVLGGSLLSPQEISSWIARQHEQERGRPDVFLDGIPLPVESTLRNEGSRGFIPDPPLCIGAEHPANRWYYVLLEYATPEDRRARSVPVAHGGVLAGLRVLSTSLAERYKWQPAQATGFVLTGLPPVLRTIDATWAPSFFQTEQGSVTALSQVVLTLDPTLRPSQVSAAFQTIRQQLLGAHWQEVNERQLALARFACQRTPEEAWEQRMAAWNTEFSQWSYKEKDLGHFKRDCQHALTKLLAPVPFLPPMPPS